MLLNSSTCLFELCLQSALKVESSHLHLDSLKNTLPDKMDTASFPLPTEKALLDLGSVVANNHLAIGQINLTLDEVVHCLQHLSSQAPAVPLSSTASIPEGFSGRPV